MRCSVVTLCSVHVVHCLPGTCLGCVLVKGQKADDILPVRTYVQNKAFRTETREIVLSTPTEKKTLRACHALQKARIEPGPQPMMCPAGLPVTTT